MNTYAYVGNNPLSNIDPLGLQVFLATRDLDVLPSGAGSPFGRHSFLVLIPDNPEDFEGSFTIGGFEPFGLRGLGNGQLGFVLGAQRIEVEEDEFRLIIQPFNDADISATLQLLNPETFTSPFSPDFSTTRQDCVNTSGQTDTELIQSILQSAANYAVNEARANIRYPSVAEQFLESDGYVNSNSFAHTLLEAHGLFAEGGDNAPGFDALSGNRIDTDYFRENPDLSDLGRHNIDTDGDGILDSRISGNR